MNHIDGLHQHPLPDYLSHKQEDHQSKSDDS